MRVCMLTSSYPLAAADSSGRFVASLAHGLAGAHGWQVCVVAPGAPGAAAREQRDGVEVIRFRYAWPRRLEVLCYSGGIPATLATRAWTGLLVPGFLAGYLRQALSCVAGCDVVHCHWTVSGLIGLLAGRRFGLPTVVTTHGSDLSLSGRSRALRLVNRYVARNAAAIVAVGSRQRAAVVALGCSPERAVHIPHGLGPDFLEAPLPCAKAVDVLFVGRMTPEKRPDLLLSALGLLARRGRPASAEFVGDGPLLADLREQAAREGVALVSFRGSVPHREVRAAMDRARCLALVSGREGMPVVALEAMARGLPVIACDVGSVSDIVRDGATGRLLPRDVSADELADVLCRFLDDDDACCRMGRAARQSVVGRYSLRRTADRYDRLYRRVMASKRQPLSG